MSIPLPAQTLDGHCSAIDNDILYVLSSGSFQSLPLKENATWSSLPTGTNVTGPACVRAVPNGDESQAALYIVGGTFSDQAYSGVQRYFFGNQTWETITPTTSDMVSRTDHSVAYLNTSASILVYAGSRPSVESAFSSQTFLISTTPPYNIEAFTSEAPPTNQPILLPWDDESAVMTGGNAENNEVWLFNPSNGWSHYSTALAEGVAPGVRGTLIEGSDGSRVLTTYDATVSPNLVSQTVLLGANGATVASGTSPTSKDATSAKTRHKYRSRKKKRDLSLTDWPTYNSTLAPSVKRTDYGVAQGSNGLAVVSGDNTADPINIFNEQDNAWVDNDLFFTGDSTSSQVPLVTSTATKSSSSSASSTASSTASASSSAASDSITGDSTSKAHMLKVLGITLGVLCGIAACFILALLLLRCRRQRRKRKQESVNEKADRMSFQDRGASFMKEAGGSVAELNQIPPAHRFTATRDSHSSLAIVTNAFRHSRGVGNKSSTDSTRQLVPTNGVTVISAPLELNAMRDSIRPVPRTEPSPPSASPYVPQAGAEAAGTANTKRSSGWSRYFATTPTEAQLPSAYDPRSQHPSTTPSNYSQDGTSRVPSIPLMPSGAFIAPLSFQKDEPQKRLANVVTGSPKFNDSSEDLAARGSSIDAARGQRAHMDTTYDRIRSPLQGHASLMSEDEASRTSSSRSHSRSSSRFSSSDYYGNESSAESAWTPVSARPKDKAIPQIVAHLNPDNVPRPPSSNYTASVYGERPRGASSTFFPGSGVRDLRDTYRPTSRLRVKSDTFDENAEAQRGSALTVFPRITSIARPTAFPVAPLSTTTSTRPGTDVRESNVTTFPTDFPGAQTPADLPSPPLPPTPAALVINKHRQTASTTFPNDFPSPQGQHFLLPPNSSAAAPKDDRMTIRSNITTFPTDFPSPTGLTYVSYDKNTTLPLVPAVPSASTSDTRTSNLTVFPRDYPSLNSPTNLLPPVSPLRATNAGGDGARVSTATTATVFPRGVSSAYYTGPTVRQVPNEDMSWLNLGLGGRI